ncbi:MAG: ABC transporter substrate-binding protein [Clostridia bacterium]|nr:ABC transporter substrate-binding protein [Clostridia bacterium]
MKTNKVLSLALIFLLLGMTIIGCGTKDGEVSEQEEKTLILAISEEIESTDVQQTYWQNVVHELLYDPIVGFDIDMKEIVPTLSSEYSVSEDGKELIFKIPSDLKYANGEQVTLEDIKGSILRYKEMSPYAADFEPIQEIIIDEDKLILKCDVPPAFMWAVLTSTSSGIVNPRAASEVDASEFSQNAVTYGMTSVDEWVQGSHITLKRNPNYKSNNPIVDNKGPLKMEKIKVRFISDNFTRVTELQSGNVDIIWDVPSEKLEELKADENINLYSYLQPGCEYINMNIDVPGLDDINVRKAIAMAIDRSELAQALNGTVEPRHGLLSPAMLGYSEDTETYLKNEMPNNIEEAKALLKEAGWEDVDNDGILEKGDQELKFTCLFNSDYSTSEKSAPIIQAQLKKIGVAIDIREFESTYVKQQVRDRNYEMATRSYFWPDGDMLMYLIHSNEGWIMNSELDSLLEEARITMSQEDRIAKYDEVQRTFFNEIPAVPLFSNYYYIAARKEVTGLKVISSGATYMNDINKE